MCTPPTKGGRRRPPPLLEQRLRDAAALAPVARRRPARPAELAAEDRAAQREHAEAEDGADAEDGHQVAEVAGGDDEAALRVERGLVGVARRPLGRRALSAPVERADHPRQPEAEEDVHRVHEPVTLPTAASAVGSDIAASSTSTTNSLAHNEFF